VDSNEYRAKAVEILLQADRARDDETRAELLSREQALGQLAAGIIWAGLVHPGHSGRLQ
jgi:hypothetical protein